MSSDFYELLGVSKSANQDTIKKAYRQKARELHPDANPDDPAAEEQFKLVSRAYETLSDTEARSRYDRFGEAGLSGGGDPFGGGGSGGLGDIFEAFFGGGGGGQRGQSGPPRGQDLEVTARIDLQGVMFGVEVSVDVKTAVTCDLCAGSGAGSGTQPVKCSECDGHGQVRRLRQSILGQMVSTSSCGRCSGTGQVIMTPCVRCSGDGRIASKETYKVDVPAGIHSGQTLRVTDRGAVGARGGPAGDLYVHVAVAQHERFRRDEDDLVADFSHALSQTTQDGHLALG